MYELKIALRQVFSRRRQTFFAVLAVSLAVAVITVMMAMLSGFQTELIQSTIENILRQRSQTRPQYEEY